jgi:hypothetical protein
VIAMQNMKDIISVAIKNLGLEKQYNAQSIILHWSEIVGDDIAANAYPRFVQQGTLMVGVNNSVWSHHLSMMKESIIDKINGFIGQKLVFDIRFQAGNLSNSQNEEDTATDTVPNIKYQLSKVKLDICDVQVMQETSSHISDKYLKQKILRIMRKDFALKKLKNSITGTSVPVVLFYVHLMKLFVQLVYLIKNTNYCILLSIP